MTEKEIIETEILDDAEGEIFRAPLSRLKTSPKRKKPQERKSFFKSINGKVPSLFPQTIGKQPEFDAFNSEITYAAGDLKLSRTLSEDELSQARKKSARKKKQQDPALGPLATLTAADLSTFGPRVSTSKLLLKAIEEFTRLNHTGTARSLKTQEVIIDLREYAADCGKDIYENQMPTPEQQAKEKARAKEAMKDVSNRAKQDAEILLKTSFIWEEKVKGQSVGTSGMNAIEFFDCRRGLLKIVFTKTFSNYLIQLPCLSTYPKTVYRIPGTSPNAWQLAIYMSSHYSNDGLQVDGKPPLNGLLSVKSLLANTNIPKEDDPTVKNHGWINRMKEPLENYLETVYQYGILKFWAYAHPGTYGQELTDEEANAIIDGPCSAWMNLIVKYEIEDDPANAGRRERRAKRAKEQKEKKKKAAAKKAKKTAASSGK